MKKALLAVPIAVMLALLATPHPTSGKAPTVKIIISGGGLAKAIEITDPRILELSHVWGGNFLDTSRGLAKEPARELPRYEVSFYVDFGNNGVRDVRKKYVVYYCPDASGRQGSIYLPGKGEPWYWLNVGSILRGQEGKWSYASPAWEALVKPLLRPSSLLAPTTSPPAAIRYASRSGPTFAGRSLHYRETPKRNRLARDAPA